MAQLNKSHRYFREIVAAIFFSGLLVGCSGGTFRFYIPKDPQTRKGKGLDLRVGRVFSKGDAICAEINPINWTKKTLKLPRSALVMRMNGRVLEPIGREEISESPTFRKGVKFYYWRRGEGEEPNYRKIAEELYAEGELTLPPRDVTVRRLLCFKLPENRPKPEDRKFSLSLEKFALGNREVKLKPFNFRELKREKE